MASNLTFPDIPGWCKDCDRQFLYDSIVLNNFRSVVEIGVYNGRMTYALAEGVKATGGVVHSVDPWKELSEGGTINNGLSGTAAREFLYTLTRYDLQEVVRVHAETSLAFAVRFRDPVDLVWIDGGHSYEDVMKDLCAWHHRSQVTYGHDWFIEEVRKAAEDYAKENDLIAGHIQGTDGIWGFSLLSQDA